MAEQASSRFTPQNKTTNERLSTTTVGLVALSDFRKRRAEVLEQQEREAREAVFAAGAAAAAASTSASDRDRSQTGTPDVGSESGADGASKKQKTAAGRKKGGDEGRKITKGKGKKNGGRKLLSFGDDDDDEDGGDGGSDRSKDDKGKKAKTGDEGAGEMKDGKKEEEDDDKAVEERGGTEEQREEEQGQKQEQKGEEDEEEPERRAKIQANASVGIVPRSVTKAALRREAAEREALRREFVALQEAVKATEIALPFVFYDGTNIPGGMVRVKKGDFVWVFLDKSRRVGAEMGVGEHRNVLRAWARARVDDLMLVRGTVIIPHHYDFYYFIMNKNRGPGGKRLFDYSAEAPVKPTPVHESARSPSGVMVTAETKAAAVRALPNIRTLEGAGDDPTLTKVVDRRWYERHKHIYPASTWQKFDPEKDYSREIRKDTGGNTFFFSK